MFRKLGMRHIVVVNIENEVVGMITRKNLVTLEIEHHPYEKVKMKQKPIFFKGNFDKTDPIGIERYVNKLKENCRGFCCGGLGLSIDAAGRVGFTDSNNQRLVNNESHSDDLRYRTSARNRRPFGSINSETDVPYVHIPYNHI